MGQQLTLYDNSAEWVHRYPNFTTTLGMFILAANKDDTIIGTISDETLNGGAGNDTIDGGGGGDHLIGGSGSDELTGGAGDDIVSGGSGNDTLIYYVEQNTGNSDVYDGGSGFDTIELNMTKASWLDPAFQADLAAYLAFIAGEELPNGQVSNAEFQFTAFDLNVSKVEYVRIVVDGVELDPTDEAVTAFDDANAINEDDASELTGNVLDNDEVPDLALSVAKSSDATYGTATLAADGSYTYTLDNSDPTIQALAEGETLEDTFTYEVTDADGDTSTAEVKITVTGTNDAVTITTADATGDVVEDGGYIAQYASSVTEFSSEYTSGSWSANQVLGAPNTDYYGDYSTSWAPGPANGTNEYITVEFNIPTYANQVVIRETYGNGFVTQVDLVDTNDVLHTVWTGVDPSLPGAPADFTVTFAQTDYLVKGVKVYTDTNHDPYAWEEIDSIQLIGDDGAADADGIISFTDVDLNDSHTATVTARPTNVLGVLTLDPLVEAAGAADGSVGWHYAIDNEAAQSLSGGEIVTETYEVTISDGKGSTTTQDVTITITGTSDQGTDIVAVGYTYYYYDTAGVAVIHNNGDGTFAPPGNFSSGISYNYYGYRDEYNYAVTAGDVNNDGIDDIVIGGYTYDDYYYNAEGLAVLIGNGDGTFQTPDTFNSNLGYFDNYYYGDREDVQDVELADINGDGNVDIVAAGIGYNDGYYYYGNGDGLSVLLGNGDGTFNAPTTYEISAGTGNGYEYEYGRDVDLADLNGDGVLDAVVVAYAATYYSDTDASVGVLFGNSDGTFQAVQNYATDVGDIGNTNEDTYAVAIGDIDNDGSFEIVTAGSTYSYSGGNTDSIAIFDVDVSGTLQLLAHQTSGFVYDDGYGYSGEQSLAVQLADVNEDGNLDIIAGGYGETYYGGIGQGVSISLGNGDGTFQTADTFDVVAGANDYIYDLEIADLDFDGNLDILVADANYGVYLLNGNGDGTFDAGVEVNDGLPYGAYDVALVDLGIIA